MKTVFDLPGYTNSRKGKESNEIELNIELDGPLNKQSLMDEKFALQECTQTINNLIGVIKE